MSIDSYLHVGAYLKCKPLVRPVVEKRLVCPNRHDVYSSNGKFCSECGSNLETQDVVQYEKNNVLGLLRW